MIPKKEDKSSLYKIPLKKLLNSRHPLYRMAEAIDWASFDEAFTPLFCLDNGRPGISTRMMVALHYLKYSENLSDEEVVEKWVQNPYWQYFCGGEYFEHEFPIHPTSMTRWRKKVSKSGAEKLLKETILTGFREKVFKKKDLEHVNVDTTVQEKNITFPTDAKLYYQGIRILNRYAKKHGVKTKQTYERVGKGHLIRQSRYAHAGQMKRAGKEVKKLKTCLGRLYRELTRKQTEEMKQDKRWKKISELIGRLLKQKKFDKDKIYSLHSPETECIAKGKAGKKYEFGNKVALVSSSQGNFILSAVSFQGNPYDGHTLQESLDKAEELTRGLGEIHQAFADGGYKGSGYEGGIEIHIVKRGVRKIRDPIKKWMSRRSAIEANIGHVKNDNRMGTNYLLGEDGNEMNAILSSAGFNLRKLLRAFLRQILEWVIRLRIALYPFVCSFFFINYSPLFNNEGFSG
jgi:IS5 family transposase